MSKIKNKTLLIVWVYYKNGFLIYNDYMKVPYNYNIKKVLNGFYMDLSGVYNINIKCVSILNIMEV